MIMLLQMIIPGRRALFPRLKLAAAILGKLPRLELAGWAGRELLGADLPLGEFPKRGNFRVLALINGH